MNNPVDSLSENQKTCLRLVGRGLSSKEIAIKTGLSPQTVDTYLKVAMGRLGASNRREASRILTALEESQKSGSPPAAVAEASPEQQCLTSTGGSAALTMVLPPPIGGKKNTLGFAERSFAILRVSVIGATVVIAIALLIAGAFEVFR